MNDVVICTNTMSLSVFHVNVSLAVQENLVGPAACLCWVAGSKNAYFCKPPNHAPRCPRASTLLAKHMHQHKYWFKISCLFKLERQCWPQITSSLFVITKQKIIVCVCVCETERERERERKKNQVCRCTVFVNIHFVWLYGINATNQKLFFHRVLCNVGNSYLHCVGGNFHKPHGSNFPIRSCKP
jgi:hypothetical protein